MNKTFKRGKKTDRNLLKKDNYNWVNDAMFCKWSSIVGFVGEIWSAWTILIWRQFYLINNVISSSQSSSSLNLVIRIEDVILENNAFP